MYSPTLRLLALLELLETYGSLQGSDLAQRLEVDPRTIRRYVTTLQDMGIPIATERGPAGSYRLERGRRLPPLIFNDSEAGAMVLGLMALREWQFPFDAAAIEGALAKTERLLPAPVLRYVNDLREVVKVHQPGRAAARASRGDFVTLLTQAVQGRRRALITYANKEGATTVRPVDVYGLVLVAQQWYAPGYCHLRKGLRIFRLDRVVSLDITEVAFDRPQDFDPLKHVLKSLEQVPEPFEVEVAIHATVDEARGFFASELHYLEPCAEGVLYRLSTSRLDWVALGLLAIEAPFTIRRPAELFEVFQRLAQRAAQTGARSAAVASETAVRYHGPGDP